MHAGTPASRQPDPFDPKGGASLDPTAAGPSTIHSQAATTPRVTQMLPDLDQPARWPSRWGVYSPPIMGSINP
jgi:hypothetical protein